MPREDIRENPYECRSMGSEYQVYGPSLFHVCMCKNKVWADVVVKALNADPAAKARILGMLDDEPVMPPKDFREKYGY